jgi:hypothetical protein
VPISDIECSLELKEAAAETALLCRLHLGVLCKLGPSPAISLLVGRAYCPLCLPAAGLCFFAESSCVAFWYNVAETIDRLSCNEAAYRRDRQMTTAIRMITSATNIQFWP